jgi:recombination protein RecA
LNAKKALQETEGDIDDLMKRVNKQYGDMSLYYLGSAKPQPVECVSTGSLALDLAIGHGERFMGIPFGRISELWGRKDSGKTTLCNLVIANAQRMGRVTAFFDFEHSYDPDYAQALGVDIDKLIFGQYTELEQGWAVVESLIRTTRGAVIVIDSIAAMTPKKEIEGEPGDFHVGLHPRLLAQAMRRNMGAVRRSDCALLVTNQVRHKIGASKYENPDTQAGGEALLHALSLKIDLYPSSKQKDDDEDTVAREIIASIPHSKIAKPYGKARYTLEFGKGIDMLRDLTDLGPTLGVIKQKGAYFYYPPDAEKNVAQGEAKLRQWLEDNPGTAEEIKQRIIETVNNRSEECPPTNSSAEPAEE